MKEFNKIIERKKNDGRSNWIYFSEKHVLHKISEPFCVSSIIDSYLIMKKNGLIVPKIITYSKSKNYFLQERVYFNNNKNKNIDIFPILDNLFLLYNNTKISIDNTSKLKTIQKRVYNNTGYDSLRGFLSGFVKNLEQFYVFSDKNKKDSNKILDFIGNDEKDLDDNFIYYVHGNINSTNILVTDNNKFFFIDYDNSGYFDYYIDLIYFYNNYRSDFINYMEIRGYKFSYDRFIVNKMIWDFMQDLTK